MTKDIALALTPMELVQQALSSGAGVDTLERLMALQERWQANEARRDFDAAIARARAEIPPIYKTHEANFGAGKTAYKYEDLADIATVVDPILPKHGLMYRWKTWQNRETGEMRVTCIVSHEHGHREESSMGGKPDSSGAKNAIQAIGSAATYLQRYTLKQALGLAAARDDDANAVSAREIPHGLSVDDEKKMSAIDAVQYRELMHLIEKTGQDERSLLNYLQANDLNTLTLPQYRAAMDGLAKKMRRIEEREKEKRNQIEAVRREAEQVKEVNAAGKSKSDVTVIDGGRGGEGTIEWKDEEPVT